MKEKKEFGTPQNELFQQLYEEAKTHTFTEKEIREGFAYIIGVGNEEFKLDIAFFPSGRVSVYENREEDEAVATYTTYENWLIYFESYRTPSNSEIDYNKAYKEDEPSGPYKPRALIDNSMYFINRDGKIIIYDEETATEYAKKLVDIERKAYEENRDHDSDPELKKMWDKYDGTGHIDIY